MAQPRLANRGIKTVPALGKINQSLLRLNRSNCRIDFPQVNRHRFAVFLKNIIQRISDHMDDAELVLGFGKTVSIAAGKPVNPSIQAIKMSLTPRFCNSVRTESQNLDDSFSVIHMPNNSFSSCNASWISCTIMPLTYRANILSSTPLNLVCTLAIRIVSYSPFLSLGTAIVASPNVPLIVFWLYPFRRLLEAS